MPDPIDRLLVKLLVILHSSLNEDSLFSLMYCLPGCGRSYLSCWVFCPVCFTKRLCVLSSCLLHQTTLCVILTRPLDLSSALSALWLVRCKSLCWHRAMRKRLGIECIECCLLSGACTFSEEKVFLSGCSVAPEPLAFRNEELEGPLEFSFGWLVLASFFVSGVSF